MDRFSFNNQLTWFIGLFIIYVSSLHDDWICSFREIKCSHGCFFCQAISGHLTGNDLQEAKNPTPIILMNLLHAIRSTACEYVWQCWQITLLCVKSPENPGLWLNAAVTGGCWGICTLTAPLRVIRSRLKPLGQWTLMRDTLHQAEVLEWTTIPLWRTETVLIHSWGLFIRVQIKILCGQVVCRSATAKEHTEASK